MNKSSKQCYTDTFEGIRLVGCGLFGLACHLVEWAYDGIRGAIKGGDKKKGKIVDAEFEDKEEQRSNG